MKRLFVMRHGKSDWSSPTSRDFDRPLAERGRRASDTIGRHLTQYPVDMVLSSPAVRALTTAERVRDAAGWNIEITTHPDLYDSTPAITTNRLRSVPSDIETLLITGHQPTWSYLVATLTSEPMLDFPTAAVACVGLESWSELVPGTCSLEWYITPKDIEA